MNKIERKKLILIIAIIGTIIVAGIVITLSILTGQSEDSPPKPTSPQPQQSQDATDSPNSSNEEVIPAPTALPGDKEVPPADAFANDYSNDEGYLPLPDGFDGSNPATNVGTVYDPVWATTKMNTLLCELSNKQTITEKAIKPVAEFESDLAKVHTPEAGSLQATVKQYVDAYEERMGERSPGSYRSELAIYCLINETAD